MVSRCRWQGGGFYCATKAAVKTITEGLRQEARGQKLPLRVSGISPGIVETEFFAVSLWCFLDSFSRLVVAFVLAVRAHAMWAQA